MRTYYYLALFLILFNSCQRDGANSKIEIPLQLKIKNKPLSLSASSRSFIFLDSIPKEFKGIIVNDSVLLGYTSTIYKSQLEKFAQQKGLSVADFQNIETRVYCLSGYEKGKQFFVLDANNNKDFSDDEKYEFDKNLSEQLKTNKVARSSLPTYKVSINEIIGDEIVTRDVGMLVYPETGHYYTNAKIKNPLLKKNLNITANVRDYFYGEFTVDKTAFKVGVSNYGFRGIEMQFREKDSVFYKYDDYRFANYYVSDTIRFNEHFYRIDTVSIVPSVITLSKLDMLHKIYGFRFKDYIRNYTISDLDGVGADLKSLFNGKDYLLIDFWGTWCAPCKELTPQLVDLNGKYQDRMSLISIAYQNEIDPIKEYVTSNKMSWFQGNIKGNPKSTKNQPSQIIQLRVVAFPTFILLDKNLQIVYRTAGNGTSFDNLVDFIGNLK